MLRISVWQLKRAIRDLIAAVQRFAQPMLRWSKFELRYNELQRNCDKSCIYFNLINHKTPSFLPWQHTTIKSHQPLLVNKLGSIVVVFTVKDITQREEESTQVPLELHKECIFFSFGGYNWECLADCFDWSHRAVRESVTEQPTIDSCTLEGLRGIGGNKSCVKIIFWCGALSTYWLVIICTNSGGGGTMPSITVWK